MYIHIIFNLSTYVFFSSDPNMSESETRSPATGSKKRKVATSPVSCALGKEADREKQHSSPRLYSTTQEYLLNLPEQAKASLWGSDRVEARKVAAELWETLVSYGDQSFKAEVDNMDFMEKREEAKLRLVRLGAGFYEVIESYGKLSLEAAESSVKLYQLTQDLKEVQSEADLGKIKLKIAKILVEQDEQEKYDIELKSTGEKACLKRRIEELEMELKQLNDRFKMLTKAEMLDLYNIPFEDQ